MAPPTPKTNPPSTAAPVNCHPLTPMPAAGISQKNGRLTVHTHNTDLPMLASM
jgi:hypothetical protein